MTGMHSTSGRLITCAITCFNAEDTIIRAVKSALAQTWPNIEVLVVDDVSSDGSVSLIEELAQTEPRLRVIRHDVNTGPGGARQTLLNEARGDFIAFFDDDDESAPERVHTQFERIKAIEAETGSQLVLCYASGERLYPNGYSLKLSAVGSQSRPPQGREIVDYLLYNRRQPGVFYGTGTPSCSLMARRSVLVGAGGFDPRFRRVEDSDMAVRVGLVGGLFVGCPEPVFRQYASTGGDKTARVNARAELKLIRKHAAYLRSEGRYRYAAHWVLVRYFHFSGRRVDMLRALWRCFRLDPAYLIGHMARSAPRRFIHEIKMR